MILGKSLTRTAGLYPAKTAIIFEDRSWSYREFNSRVNRLAGAISQMGLVKGDKMAVLARNCPEYLEAYHALAKLGVWMVPINFRLLVPEISYRLLHSQSSGLILGPEYLEAHAQLDQAARGALGERVLVLGDDPPPAGMRSYEQAIANSEDVEPEADVNAEDTLFIGYTGGTTGRSKGALISNRAIVAGYLYKALEYGHDEHDLTLNPGPFWHTAPRNCCLAFYFGGATVVMRDFSPHEYLKLVEKHRVTSSFLVPTMLSAILDLPDLQDYDLSSLRVITVGGAPMSIPLKRAVIEHFGDIIYEHYAATETLILTTINARDMPVRMASVGRPSWDVYLKIVDNKGREAPAGQVGEILIKGPSLFNGYFNDPEKTREAMVDGWLTLGDMGRFDDEGFLYVVDRKKDMIISGGENIYPREIEEVLMSHPRVAEAAVIGVPDDHWGEVVKAVVVLKNGQPASPQELMDYCAGRLADYLKPRLLDIVAELPKSPVGKVLRRKLRDQCQKDGESPA
jgi:acyl-CoA synthetase (AMP-forming)/AMP-acid ligase II